MNPNKKIIAVFVFFIFLFISFSGCIIEDLLSDGSSNTSFSLSSWSVIDDEGFPALDLFFSCSDLVTIKLYNPHGVEIDSDFFYSDTIESVLHLAEYGEVVTSGDYSFKAYDSNNKRIYSTVFRFSDSDLTILSCTQKWWKRASNIGGYTLMGLSMIVQNNGDTPLYPYEIELNMDSLSYYGKVVPVVVPPGKSQKINCVVYKNGAPENSNFDVIIKDRSNKDIGTGSFTANVANSVYSKTYNWRYDFINRRVELPDLDFLFDYYNLLDRVLEEDYSFYIFDPFDDPYIDMLSDSIMADFSSSDDEEIINYVASFVQNLDYKPDSLTDNSYEYPRYPIQTLFNGVKGGGDCEDLAILTACILDNMGYDVALIRLPEHMAVGVELDGIILPGDDYFVDSYYFLETTSPGKTVGSIPEDYKKVTDIDVFPINSRPLLIHHWKNGSLLIYTQTEMGNFVKVNLVVENIGRTTGFNIKVEGAFYTSSGNKYNEEVEIINSLQPFSSVEVMIKANIPKSVQTTFKTRVYYDDELVDERESSSTFPTD